ncbi:single-strand selective monofunctional uracil DNA glycosylase-like isoform X1 [Asterias rubens]|uniref:single-strand selective monofunctional uracil DNA glycosylase-like isoform X1 n=2 Tax=Asterias rubens TaxID=7604 RepID=UPI001455D2EE|nr:single-strand selective monofunctional uracil DNA glycosylase-like isoform X1 [Asterias rubens]
MVDGPARADFMVVSGSVPRSLCSKCTERKMPPKRKSKTESPSSSKTAKLLTPASEKSAEYEVTESRDAVTTDKVPPSNKNEVPPSNSSIAERFLSELVAPFNEEVVGLTFEKPIEYVYNPLEYAREPHEDYIRKYCNSTKDILFLGMNPGPFGMAQNGVPFGEHDSAVNFLGITGNVGKPPKEHPKRQIVGLSCPRKEVSGSRFWGLWKTLCKTPEEFFRHAFVYNHCSLVFMSETGKNITPPDMRVGMRKQIVELGDDFVCKMVKLLEVKVVVGIGKFAEQRAKKALEAAGIDGVRVVVIMHPSPINPAANKGWDQAVTKQLKDLNLLKYFKK